jgi:hypothetical protein
VLLEFELRALHLGGSALPLEPLLQPIFAQVISEMVSVFAQEDPPVFPILLLRCQACVNLPS